MSDYCRLYQMNAYEWLEEKGKMEGDQRRGVYIPQR
jgi:hypothetical protein